MTASVRSRPTASRPDLAHARAIAVLRANGVGDYLMAEPALAALRVAAPRARITLLGGAWEPAALNGRPGPVDEVVSVPWVAGVRTPRAGQAPEPVVVERFFARMRARDFDVAFQLHGGGRNSNPVVRSLGARCTVGLQAADAEPLDLSVSYQYWQPEILRYLEVVTAAGAEPVRVHPQFPVLDADVEAAEAVLRRHGPTPWAPVAVIHPGATDPQRRWPADRFGHVGRALAGAGAHVVVIGTPPEADVVAAVTRAVPGARSLVGLSFRELVGLLRLAELLVGNDSGPRHLADAVGTPTVAVYWFGNVINSGPVGRADHRIHISWTQRCPQCGASCLGEPFPERCYHAVSLVADVGIDPVSNSAMGLFRRATATAEQGRAAHG